MFLQLLLLVQLSRIIQTSSATLLPKSKPGCETQCGNLTISYPFGIGPGENGCSFTGDGLQLYNITCDTSFNPPKPSLWLGLNKTSGKRTMYELLSISETELRVKKSPSTMCYQYKTGNVTLDESFSSPYFLSTRNTPFTVSSTRNKLFGIGCYSMAYFLDPNRNFSTKCTTILGVVKYHYLKGIKRFLVYADSMNSTKESLSFNPCSYSFIDLIGTNFRTKGRDIPIVLDWAIGNKTCEEAQKDLLTFACQKNSDCSNSDKVPGYLCTCNTGFMGNPYLSPGCQDVNECEDEKNNPCAGICTNTIGSYNCSCPDGHHGDGRKGGIGCIRKNKEFPILKLSIKRRKLHELKEKFFQQNGGLLLKQQLSSYEGGAEATRIFSAEELKVATSNYSDKLILGTGGFGTVYLGTVKVCGHPTQNQLAMIAIKKSKVIDETQIEQFINELVILAQVNHRNVVKVLGCCLETEVPLLVYEYISNGTLFQHIHNKADGKSSSTSLSWKSRLRIATESAGALAYLHSAASIPIIHRDIKSANILLDENYTAKVSDFGASRLNTLGQTQIDTLVQGTLGYLDPEYFLTSQLTDKSDVYSFGVVLVELLTGEQPLSLNRSQEQRSLASFFLHAMERNDVFKLIEPRVANEASREHIIVVSELAGRCLYTKGEYRPTMKQVSTELENLNKSERQPSGAQNQQSHDKKKSTAFTDEPTDLYSVPISSYTSGDSGQYSMEKDPGCQSKCGNISIPYPFVIMNQPQDDCSIGETGLEIGLTCNTSFNPPKPFTGNVEIIDISESEVRTKNILATLCYNESGDVIFSKREWMETGKSFTLSYTKNMFFAIGCDTYGSISGDLKNTNYKSSCSSDCENRQSIQDESCFGNGCCQITIPKGLAKKLRSWKTFHATRIVIASILTIIQDIVALVTMDMRGIRISVPDAKDQNSNPCMGICTNTIGSYKCSCPKGSRGDGRRGGSGCFHNNQASPVFKISLGIGLGIFFLIIGSFFLCVSMRKRNQILLKAKFFHKNGGLLLKQQISSQGSSGESSAKIFTAEELKLATKNYDEKLILGRGGHGVVYKGTLSDSRIVAIKKSKIIDESQIEEFINELVILTQVNHRNVVKVLGCCLETEVPLLVYEYISNGTLSQHIHKTKDAKSSSISWESRLKIAAETAGAIAYLHSAASIPIIHRDIKSANVLLDENLTAKVADFGASRLNPLDQNEIDTLVQGTLGYLDPEYHQSGQLTGKSDVYSFGVVLVELLTGETPISFERDEAQRNIIPYFISLVNGNDMLRVLETRVATKGNREQVLAVGELAKRCLSPKGGERPTMKQVSMQLEGLRKVESSSTHSIMHDLLPKQNGKFTDSASEPTDLYAVPMSSYSISDSNPYSFEVLLNPR
ncbi:hypothetical protein MKX01_042301 [Papaver californicum]|nr:hypothetical protein MKX01_042301 [Papaver californicum]